jgi:hypothetical protein
MTADDSTFDVELFEHLSQFASAPFLFVGSGFSLRYADADNWVALLERMAGLAGKPYAYYASSADGDPLQTATLIADDLRERWWSDPEFEASRKEFPNPAGRESPFKYEVAKSLRDIVSKLPEVGPLNDELEALRSATIEGIITTNFDEILEYVFPDFVPYVGQDELLFNDPRGVAEIYKIHGSAAKPESLVITAADFERFRPRNPYLAAKLLTIFVEHPVIFLGYSLSDPNIRSIIASIASVLTNDNIHQLENRLLFLNWDPKASKATIAPSTFALDDTSIPIRLITAPDFLATFDVLGRLHRRFPAKILRHLKDQVYELARTSEPSGTVVVSDLESDTDLTQVDVVIGVGVTKRLQDKGITGLTRRDLIFDILDPRIELAHYEQIVVDVLPALANQRTHTPIYQWLRGAGLLEANGDLVSDPRISTGIRARSRLGIGPLRPSGYFGARARRLVVANPSLSNLTSNLAVADALLAIPFLEPESVNADELRDYLVANQSLFSEGTVDQATRWTKCVFFYDFIVNKTPVAPRWQVRPKKGRSRRRSKQGVD